MKKFFMMAVMAVVALTASAQKGEFHVTPHISLGYAHMSNAAGMAEIGSVDIANNVLGGIGADAEYMITNEFGLSFGLDYNYLRSSKNTLKDANAELEFYTTYSFLNIPVLAQYHFGEGFAIKAGIQPMFLLTADLHVDGKSNTGMMIGSGSCKDNCQSVSLAIPVGISYTFETPITLDLRCNIPVTNLNKEGDSNKLLGITATIGYRF